MVKIKTSEKFEKILDKIDKSLLIKIDKQVDKIVEKPKIGKPMMYGRKGTRELYIKPFRLSYFYDKDSNSIILLDLYHKKKQ